MKVKKKDVEFIVRQAFPNYKGRKYSVEPTTQMMIYNLNWEGGSLNRYVAVALVGGAKAELVPRAPWVEYREGTKFEIPLGVAIVQHTYFMGKDLGIRIYVRPENMPLLLPGG